MNHLTFKLTKLHQLLLLIILVFLGSCDTDTKAIKKKAKEIAKDIKEVAAYPVANDQQSHFYYAWLADCINDIEDHPIPIGESAQSYFTKLATHRITSTCSNSDISQFIGGTQELVWGPVLLLDDLGDDAYVSKNLMYCVKTTRGSDIEYNVGVAGTNMVSKYDWLSEDFNVTEQHPGPAGGLISEGSSIGYSNLMQMTDPKNNNETLANFLSQEIINNPGTVSVSGHSLGGALTQVLSVSLKDALRIAVVKAWVYAGPTAGDANFVASLNILNGYQGFNNRMGVVPKAWQKDKLQECCTIYDQITQCGENIGNNVIITAVIQYLLDISAGKGYTVPPNTSEFPGETFVFKNCTENDLKLDALYESDLYSLTSYFTKVKQDCILHATLSRSDFQNVFYYFGELGLQHTTAYFNHFIPDNNPKLRKAINTFVPGEKGSWDELFDLEDGLDVLSAFFERVAAHSNNCSCS